jgi:hypothetical protein
MVGPASTPAAAWLANSKAYGAALLVGMQLDIPADTLLERETRRRLWWHIVLSKK